MKYLITVISVLSIWYYLKTPEIKIPNTDISFKYKVKKINNLSSDESLPLIIALHGNGDSMNNFFKTALNEVTQPARVILIQAPYSMGIGYSWPIRTKNIATIGPALLKAIQIIKTKYIHKGQPILFGFSGGAIMTYYLSAVEPNEFSYSFPISGKLSKELFTIQPTASTLIPLLEVYAFHGDNDNVISINVSHSAQKLLESLKIKVSLHYNH